MPSNEGLRKSIVALQEQVTKLENTFRLSMKQTYDNHMAIKEGLDASEFNLRAHQKALNATMLELQALGAKFSTLQVKEDKAGIDWSTIHESVEADLKAMAEAEAKSVKETYLALESKLDWLFEGLRKKADAEENPANRINARDRVAQFSNQIREDMQNLKEDKEYNTQRLAAILPLMAKLEEEEKAASQPAEAQPVEEVTEFGGDVANAT